MSAQELADLFPAQLDLFLLFELLGQMMIVETLVLPPGELDDPLDDFLLGLALTHSATVAVNHSFGSDFADSGLDPVTLPFTDSQDQCGLLHGQLASIHSLDYVQSFLVSHGQGCHRSTLT